MKYKIFTAVSDLGDGSSVALLFANRKQAEEYADWCEAEFGDDVGLRDSISEVELEFDENGILLSHDRPHLDE